jgi:hypothetical protein
MVIMRGLRKHQEWSDAAVFEDLNAAQAVGAFLKDRKFEARTYDDKLFRYFLFLRPPRVTYHVQVRRNDLKSAAEHLNASAPAAMQLAIRCPSCGSLRVAYPQMTRKFVLPTIVLHLGILLHLIDHECYCEHCQFNWHLPAEKGRPARKPAHLFPF